MGRGRTVLNVVMFLACLAILTSFLISCSYLTARAIEAAMESVKDG